MAPTALAAMMATESDGVTKNLHTKETVIYLNLQLAMILNTNDATKTLNNLIHFLGEEDHFNKKNHREDTSGT